MKTYKDYDKTIMETDEGDLGYVFPYRSDGVGIPRASLDEWSLCIKTNNLKIVQHDVGLTIDIPNDVLSQISSLEINGFKFIKEQ